MGQSITCNALICSVFAYLAAKRELSHTFDAPSAGGTYTVADRRLPMHNEDLVHLIPPTSNTFIGSAITYSPKLGCFASQGLMPRASWDRRSRRRLRRLSVIFRPVVMRISQPSVVNRHRHAPVPGHRTATRLTFGGGPK